MKTMSPKLEGDWTDVVLVLMTGVEGDVFQCVRLESSLRYGCGSPGSIQKWSESLGRSYDSTSLVFLETDRRGKRLSPSGSA